MLRAVSRFALGCAILTTGCYDGMDGRPAEPLGDRAKSLAPAVRIAAADHGVAAMGAAPNVRLALVKLGNALAFDKTLSGNRDISCMTCHHPTLGTGDARSLSIGAGATGLGSGRTHPDGTFIPRSAPPLFNLHEMDQMFWDGRVAEKYGGIVSPAGAHLTQEMVDVFEFGAVSAQAMFPVTSDAEMRGAPGTNEIADLPADDFTAIWAGYMARLGEIPEYRQMFEWAYPGVAFDDMTFAHAANAIAGFEIATFASGDSDWDNFLGGKDSALNKKEMQGALAFFDSGCGECHSGRAMSDFGFHNTGLPQVGPGKGDGPGGTDDFGRFRETGAAADKYAFRTAPLRNVELTGPYGHDGQFPTLDAFVGHYVDPEVSLVEYDPSANLEKALQGAVVDNADDVLETLSPMLGTVDSDDVSSIVAFLRTMTDKNSKANKLKKVVPSSVPSGLPVKD